MRDAPSDRRRLEPAGDLPRWESAIDSIMRAAGPELARRRGSGGVAGVLSGWIRPGLSAAATVAIVSGSILLTSVRSVEGGEAAPLLSEALVPDVVAAWIEADVPPTLAELADAMYEGDSP